MFAKETYIQRRALLKKNIGSGVLLFLGNDEQGLHYEDNTFRYRQDSTFLYYFGLSFAGLSAIIDIDEDKEIIFGDELTIDHIVWMGTQPTLKEKSGRVGITEVMPSAEIMNYLHKAVRKGQTVHYLPPYRAEHKLKLMEWLGIPPARQEGSVPFIRAIVAQRSYKSAEEVEEIEKACNVTADMHITAMKVLRPGMYEYEVVAEMNRVAESNNCELSFATIATVNGQTLHNHYHGNKVKPGDLFLIDAGADLVRRGGYIDCTAGADDVEVESDAMKLYELLHREGVKLDHVTISSDAFGSQPRFNEEGECIGLTYASPKYLHRTIQILVREGMPLEAALQLLTSTPAVLLGQEGVKGCVAEGADADLLVLDENLDINSLFARGQVAVWEQEVKMKGRFEQ